MLWDNRQPPTKPDILRAEIILEQLDTNEVSPPPHCPNYEASPGSSSSSPGASPGTERLFCLRDPADLCSQLLIQTWRKKKSFQQQQEEQKPVWSEFVSGAPYKET